MIIHDYDIETEPIVNLECFYGKPGHGIEKCLILFSKVSSRTASVKWSVSSS